MNDENDQVDSPGWDAIDAALRSIYGDQEPKHFGTLISWQLGGNDPLRGISAYKRLTPLPHWHFVTYGLSELFEKESDDPETSGYGFELAFRLACDPAEEEPPSWALGFLQNIARYVFQSGNVFRAGHYMNLNGPIALGHDTKICSIAFVEDPELPPMHTPNGRLEFLQIVGMTLDEEVAAKCWQTGKLLALFGSRLPLFVTDLKRASLMQDAEIAAQARAGAAADGSNTGFLFIDVLAWREEKRLLRSNRFQVTLGAKQTEELRLLLPGRLPFGREFALYGSDAEVRFKPASAFDIHIESGALHIDLTAAQVTQICSVLQPKAGTYSPAFTDGLSFEVIRNEIRDSEGNVAEVFG